MPMVLVVTCNCGFAENRRNQWKSTPKGGGNSPKSGDDRVGQVFVCVTAGSNGVEGRVDTGTGSLFCHWTYRRDALFDSTEQPHIVRISPPSLGRPQSRETHTHTHTHTHRGKAEKQASTLDSAVVSTYLSLSQLLTSIGICRAN